VGLTERFDKSLALASHVFGWTSEILYWPEVVNEARTPESHISIAAREAILNRNELDRELYRFAQDRFQHVVEDLGAAFQSRLQALRVRNHDATRVVTRVTTERKSDFGDSEIT
jgi:hypothetical protein